ncbi:MAG: IS701 family transposase [Thermodesulfobacteriota bacterium]
MLTSSSTLPRRLAPEQRGRPISVDMLSEIAAGFPKSDILVVTDSWFGNNGLWNPLRISLGNSAHMISRLRSNNNLYDLPEAPARKGPGRPRIYGHKLGNSTALAQAYQKQARQYTVNLYGKNRTVFAYDRVVMLKTLKCPVRVVWIYRKTQWVALFSTDLSLAVEEIIEYYGARWKIESGFKELKRDIGSAETQSRRPTAVNNHLDFCMMATCLTWVYASRLENTPVRKHAVSGRGHFAFSDVRRLIAQAALSRDFAILRPVPRKSVINSFVTALMRMAA